MQFQAPFDEAEYLRAHRAVQRVCGGNKLTLLLAFGFPLGLTLFSLFLGGLLQGHVRWDRVLIWPWFFFPLFTYFGIPWITRWSIKRAMKQNHRLRGQITREVTAQGLECRDDGTSAKFEWRAIERVVETEEFFLFFYTAKCAYFIPRRMVPDVDLAPLRALVRRHVGQVELLDTPETVAA